MAILTTRERTVSEQWKTEWERFRIVWAFEHPHRRPRIWREAVKRAIDIVGALALLAASAPLMAVIAVAIKCDSPGSVFYRQWRAGLGGEAFKIIKFRSMVMDAEAGGPRWSDGSADSRITRVGAFLRKTHLDELPQLWNVLRGEMSLVGPRPERPCFTAQLERLIRGYSERQSVKPGMTGLAQVHYRYDANLADVRRKLRFDRLYINRMCLGLDARILFWTLAVVLFREGQ